MQCVFFFNISKHYFWTKASRASAYSLDIFKFFVLFWSSIFLYYIFLWKKCSRGRPGIGMSVIILIHQPEKYSKSSRYREHGIQLRKPWDLLNKIWLSFFSYTWLIWRISSMNTICQTFTDMMAIGIWLSSLPVLLDENRISDVNRIPRVLQEPPL